MCVHIVCLVWLFIFPDALIAIARILGPVRGLLLGREAVRHEPHLVIIHFYLFSRMSVVAAFPLLKAKAVIEVDAARRRVARLRSVSNPITAFALNLLLHVLVHIYTCVCVCVTVCVCVCASVYVYT
jgi:hypothetical protein